MKTSNLAAAPLLALASFASAAAVPSEAAPELVRADLEAAPRYVPDCRDVVFQPEDPPLSRPVTLSSQELFDDCVPDGARGEGCFERPGPTESLTVRLSLPDRKTLLPWESDVFRVCLTGPVLRTDVVSTAYDYAVVRDGAVDGFVVLTSGAKRRMPPDPRGIQAVLSQQLTLQFHDQWASYYPGGSVVLKIALKKEVRFWADETIVEKTITLPVADNYVVELGGAVTSPGGIYYARYSIVRLGGTVSTEAETPTLETQKVSYESGGGPGI
jgi:hypothetical protein